MDSKLLTTETYSIHDLEVLSGIKAHTLRIWEKRYGLIKPGRTTTNIRHYTGEDLKQLLNISLLYKSGYRISSIARMSATERLSRLTTITLLKEGIEGTQEGLLLSLIEMNEARFNNAFTSVIIRFGLEEAFTKIIFPFFDRIGIMWQLGTISPAQEHFFSCLVRQKIIAATDASEYYPAENAETVLLFLPEGELHEIALLFYNYAFRARGYWTLYLGQGVPFDCIEDAIRKCTPDYIVTGITTSIQISDVKKYIEKVGRLFPCEKTFYTGPVTAAFAADLPETILSVEDLRKMLKI